MAKKPPVVSWRTPIDVSKLQAFYDRVQARCGELERALREMIQSHDCVEGRQACICDRCIRSKAILARTPAAAAERVAAMEAVCEAAIAFKQKWVTDRGASRAELFAALSRLDAAGDAKGGE